MKKYLTLIFFGIITLFVIIVYVTVSKNKNIDTTTTTSNNQNKTINESGTTESLHAAMTQVLSQKYNRSPNTLKVVTIVDTGTYAKGSVNFSDGGGGLWFASKTNGDWQLVFDGNGIITCSYLDKYPDFPASLIPKCFDEKTNDLVER